MSPAPFRSLYKRAREAGYVGTRVEFCALILRTPGLASEEMKKSAAAWLVETDADITHVPTPRRNQ